MPLGTRKSTNTIAIFLGANCIKPILNPSSVQRGKYSIGFFNAYFYEHEWRFSQLYKGSQGSIRATTKKSKRPDRHPKLTPLQQRKRDALELAELIYKIYNENCPVITNEASKKGNKND